MGQNTVSSGTPNRQTGNGPPQGAPTPPPKPIVTPFSLPKLIAVADESLDKVEGNFQAQCADGATRALAFGGDITHGTGGKVPFGEKASDKEDELKKKIMVLPKSFDKTGKAKKEFEEFLKKNSAQTIYTDPDLDKTIAGDENFIAFSDFTLNVPGSKHYNAGRVRIHQVLKTHNWDIRQVNPITGLGTAAFDRGSPVTGSDNYGDGLKIMIDAVAHVLVYVSSYVLYPADRYEITLIFELWDCFGLDDEDIQKFGYKAKMQNQFSENEGFTAWWQLQHQFDYSPLMTKATVTRSFTAKIDP